MEELREKEVGLAGTPRSEFGYFVDGKEVGFLQIRHTLGSRGPGVPEHMTSHVYYEVVPTERGKGYATRMLARGIQKAKEMGMKELIITAFESNPASIRVIEKNGGIFIEDAFIPGERESMRKYRVDLQ